MVKKPLALPYVPVILGVIFAVVVSVFGHTALHLHAQAKKPERVNSVRLYVFELGNIRIADVPNLWEPPLKFDPDSCCVIAGHLIVHPKGTLMWDTGTVPDHLIGTKHTNYYSGRPLRAKLAEIGYRPEDITYLGLTHWHFDHTANANLFKNSTWIVQEPERNVILAALEGKTVAGGARPDPSHYDALKNGKTIVLANMDEYDVFGDGTVIIKQAYGHTAGQQVLVLKLPKTGRVMLAGDLYHLHEERAAQVVPKVEFDPEQSLASRRKIEDYIKQNKIALWLEHDSRLYARLKKAPNYIE